MKKNSFRIGLTIAFILLSGWFLYPTVQDYFYSKKLREFSSPEDSLAFVKENRKSIDAAQEKRLKLGLDLKGGMHVVLEVDVLELLELKARNRDAVFDSTLAAVRARAERENEKIPVLLAQAFKQQGIRLSRYFYDLRDSDDEVVEKLNKEVEEAVNRAKEIIRNRVDQFGVAEPTILTKGGRRIIVELPGVSDKERVRKLLKGTAKLEFKLVRDPELALKTLSDINKYLARQNRLSDTTLANDSLALAKADSLAALPDSLKSQEQLKKDNPLFAIADTDDGIIIDPRSGALFVTETAKPKVFAMLNRADVRERFGSDIEFLPDARPFQNDAGENVYRLYPLKREAELEGGVIVDARATFSIDGSRPEVTMKMNDEGTRKWARITGANIDKQIAIVLDGVVFSAPVVKSKIPNGSSVINGLASAEEARDLEIVLRAGALPAPVRIVEERTVGASLGEDAIRAGLYSVLAGFFVVAIFMILYYRVAGFIADFALVFNILFVIAFLAGFSATLTLPGIAGLVLTIGMAVDANVLIFERVREEHAKGKLLKLAIEIGYDKAFSAILDSHVTTFGAAALLYTFGIGPIQGFAVTLMIGIAASLFTAIVITKISLTGCSSATKSASSASANSLLCPIS
ncbi:MAG: protein translocase subunit SecD [Candidatus Thermochlorobacter aerophilum]|uniref:Protein translocase subunit SecD n=1 Tax=Candidatus Thermochlorobacter aerophilus TaxID=1868324 RepID=A0A395LYK2_9BACT|nr:MAG: protein translocase subunit SecD [Candidatus Thermochlorobacter aerophilum]